MRHGIQSRQVQLDVLTPTELARQPRTAAVYCHLPLGLGRPYVGKSDGGSKNRPLDSLSKCPSAALTIVVRSLVSWSATEPPSYTEAETSRIEYRTHAWLLDEGFQLENKIRPPLHSNQAPWRSELVDLSVNLLTKTIGQYRPSPRRLVDRAVGLIHLLGSEVSVKTLAQVLAETGSAPAMKDRDTLRDVLLRDLKQEAGAVVYDGRAQGRGRVVQVRPGVFAPAPYADHRLQAG